MSAEPATLPVVPDDPGLHQVGKANTRDTNPTVGSPSLNESGPPKGVRDSAWASQNLALLVSGALLLASVIRVYFFSYFNTPVALEIISVSNRANILIATFLSCFVALSPILLIMSFTRIGGALLAVPGTRLKIPSSIVLTPFALLAIVGLPLYLHWMYFLTTVVLVVVGRRGTGRRRRGKPRPVPADDEPSFRRVALENLAFYLVIGALMSPWQAQEKISVKSSGDPIFGYVMGDQAEKVLVIDAERKVVWLDQDEITKREACGYSDGSSWVTSSIAEVLQKDKGVNCGKKSP